MTKYETVCISDLHLGSKGCQAEKLNDFLKTLECKNLYLIGDIIDGWKIAQNKMRWKNSHTEVIRHILRLAKRGTRVYYVVGNHDEFLRPLLKYSMTFGRIEIANSFTHTGVKGKRYLVVHGDLFDGITRLAPWLSVLGDRAYGVLLSINYRFNWIRRKLGFGYWSLSAWLKSRVKKAVNFLFEFELNITSYAKRKGYEGVICGHIHTAAIKIVNDIEYMNDGDWVESCTALVEDLEGNWRILCLY